MLTCYNLIVAGIIADIHIVFIKSCSKHNSDYQINPSLRKGVWCMDGTRTFDTNSNAPDHFGSVREWIRK
jgi:hypothetical protein